MSGTAGRQRHGQQRWTLGARRGIGGRDVERGAGVRSLALLHGVREFVREQVQPLSVCAAGSGRRPSRCDCLR
jgi:hypothetical protein